MPEVKQKLFNGRPVKEELIFNMNEGTFQNMYAANSFLKSKGYTFGSTDSDRKTRVGFPVAILKGEYTLPQKWHNFSREDKARIDGVMISDDWREGEVKVLLFEDKTVL